MPSTKGSSAPGKVPLAEDSMLGALQGPQEAAVTLQTAPLLEIPNALVKLEDGEEAPIQDEHPVATIIRGPFTEVAEQQLAATVDQLLLAYGVSDAATWGPIISHLAEEAAGKLSPALAVAYGNLDPRFYIKVKKVAGVGTPADSSIVDGVVCRKNIAHKRMRRRIENAKILLIGGSVEFNRTQSRLTSLESVTKQQEEENLQNQVDKLVALQPDIILVERSVARTAQEELLERGISLALNMKRSVLDFLSRCTGAEVAASVDSASAKCVATCQEFVVEDTYPAPTRVPVNCATPSGAPAAAAAAQLPEAAAAKLPSVLESSGPGANSELPSVQPDAAKPGAAAAVGQTRSLLLDKPSGSYKGDARSAAGSAFGALDRPAVSYSGGSAGRAGAASKELGTPQNSLKMTDSVKGMMAARTLMFFKGCPHALGCTVLLKGAPREPLVAIKKVMQFAVYAAYRNRLETAFLADQLASAISTAGEAPWLTSPEKASGSSRLASSAGTPQPSAPSTPTKSVLANGSAAADPPPVPVSHPHGGVSIGTPVPPAPDETRSEQDPMQQSNSGSASLMSSLMASSAPSRGPTAEPVFSRAVSSAMQPMGSGAVPSQLDMPHPPFREQDRDQQQQEQQGKATLQSQDSVWDLQAADVEELTAHARRVVQRSAYRTAALRGDGPLVSLSPHVTVGAAEWTGAEQQKFPLESGHATADETAPDHDSADPKDRNDYQALGTAQSRLGSIPGSTRSRLSSVHEGSQEEEEPESSQGDVEEIVSSEEQRAEAGELLGLQRLYVTTALSNQPRGELSKPPEVKRIDYYQRTDQALSQFLSGASAHSLSTDVTTYLHGDGLLTLRVARLPEGQELPGADTDQVWFWLRPRQASLELLDAARRVPLSRDAAAMSLGHFLEVSFGARHLSVGPRPLHAGYARYFGRGAAVACFLWERVGPTQVDMPPQHMHYYVPAQQGWIKDEVEELIEEANTVFAAIENALKRREEQLAARAKHQQQEAAQRAVTSAQPRPAISQAAKPPLAAPLTNHGSAAATGQTVAGRSPEALNGNVDEDSGMATAGGGPDSHLVMSQLRDALVAEVSGLADNVQEVCSMIRADTAALAHPNGVLTESPRKQAHEDHLLEGLSNETLVLAIWRINSLRRSLAIMALTWASCLHDPNTFAPRQAASLPAQTMARANSTNSLASAQSLPMPSVPSLPTHSRNSSAGAVEVPNQDINLRVLIAHSAAAAAASSAPGSPSDSRTPPNPFAGTDPQASDRSAATEEGPGGKAGAAPALAKSVELQPIAGDDEAGREVKELLSLVSSSEQAGQPGNQKGMEGDSGHLTAQTSATSSCGATSSAMANGGSPDVGHLLASPASSGPLWERAHSAPTLPRFDDVGNPTSHPVRSDSLLSLLGDGTESVLSAPGNIEAPVAAAQAALDAEPIVRPPPRTASASAADDLSGRYQGASSIVSRYVSMFEARQPVISMPAWQRQELRGRSTDLVLRFLNRQRRPRTRPAADAPGDASAGQGPLVDRFHSHHSDSGSDHSGSEDEHDEDHRHGSEDGSTTSEGFRTPPRNRSPLRTRSPNERSGTGSPLHPSRLGDANRATTAEKGAGIERVSSPLRTHSIDLDNVRSNLSKGAGGALSPVLLSPPGQHGGLDIFPESGAEMRSLLDGGVKGASETERILERLERTRNWAAQVPKAVDSDGRPAQPAAVATTEAADARPDKPNAQSQRADAEVVQLKEVLAREPSEVQLHFNRDTWKTLADTERAIAQADESAKQPSGSPQQASEAPASTTQQRGGSSTPERPVISRPVSPAPAQGTSVVPLVLTEEALSKLSLPRKAQQLPGVILLPNGQEIRLVGRSLLVPGVDDRVVVVRDDEPTSLVAYALSSREYGQFLANLRAGILNGSPQPRGAPTLALTSQAASRSTENIAAQDEAQAAAAAGNVTTGREEGVATAAAAPPAAPETDAVTPNATATGREPAAVQADCARTGKGCTAQGSGCDDDVEWGVLMWHGHTHFDHTVVDHPPHMPGSRTRLSISVWFPAQFAELRRMCLSHCGGEAAFCASLSRCHRWEPRGGKSNSFFAKTRDDRFIVKQLSLAERKSFQEIAPKYFAYLARAMRDKQPTCLAKIMGVFTVRLEKEKAMDLLVMENVFYERSLSPVYDLKGSERARWCKDDPNDPTTVLLDENLKRSILSAPLLVESSAHAALMKALWADTAFLAGQGVMDYSLIVGVDTPNGALVVGIIDFLRQYTWDKALERWVKSVGMGQDPRKAPTIQSPKDYCKRFRGAMASYFTCVPSEGDVPAPLDVSAGLAD
ncbi:probable 1-phosphatidylinositol-3-phosphate 5-kinase FAB1C [Coccomyxa sp. Obi]|nr:probable 1-phosphatidylinositol-3-phosphate 5-kinase FAB1C [Coccomyxa sp. Obi]